MKNSPLATVLLVLLACAAIGSLLLCWTYIKTTRELRMLQSRVADVNAKQQFMNLLVNDVLEYSKRNPQIDPILENSGIKPKPGGSAPATNSPGKAGSK